MARYRQQTNEQVEVGALEALAPVTYSILASHQVAVCHQIGCDLFSSFISVQLFFFVYLEALWWPQAMQPLGAYLISAHMTPHKRQGHYYLRMLLLWFSLLTCILSCRVQHPHQLFPERGPRRTRTLRAPYKRVYARTTRAGFHSQPALLATKD